MAVLTRTNFSAGWFHSGKTPDNTNPFFLSLRDTMGVCMPREERDHRSIEQDRLFFLLLWGRPVNKVTLMGTKNERVPH